MHQGVILESIDDVLAYEDEIVGLHKLKGYSKNGRNGCIQAIQEFCLSNDIYITETVNLQDVVDKIFWV